MGPYLQFRLWLKRAPRSEVVISGVVALLVLALIGWALVPTGSASGSVTNAQDIMGDPPASLPASPGTSRPAEGSGAEDPAPGPAPSPPLGSTPTTAPSTTPDDAVRDPAGEEDSDQPDPAPGQPASPQPSAPPPPLRATDRGVTAETIKVGFLVAALRNLDQSGRVLGLREDAPEAIRALVDDLNRRGGIHGRQVEPIIVKADPLDPSDQRAKCLQLTEQDQVFAAIDVIATGNTKTSQACFTVEHETPFVHNVPFSAEFMQQGYPYDVSTQGDLNQYARNWVFAARDAGFFDPNNGFEKLGILDDACFPEALDPADGLLGYLEQIGIGPDQISEFRTACDIGTAQRQVAQAVLQHKQDGVTHVFLATTGPSERGYLQQADAQLFNPDYFDSDFLGSTNNVVADDNSPSQWDRVQAVTSFYDGASAAGHPLPPRAQKCSQALEEHGLPPITGYAEDTEIVAFCELFDLFAEIALAAGPELTRPAWGQAVATVGDFDGSKVLFSRFDRPGKVAGADRITIVEWRRECRCWYQIGPWRDAY